MRLLSKVLTLILMVLLVPVTTVWAQTHFVPPWSPNLVPQWASIPQVPGVYYVPNLGHDLFRYNNQYYIYQQGRWHQGDGLDGPWRTIANPPQPFYNIGPNYFNSPPGWTKGKKTGWRGAPLPPGQMKKLERGGSLPPGQMKKFE